jgi:mannose-6-phosphate isomerase
LSSTAKPLVRRLPAESLDKIWGTPAVEPWFVSGGRKIGEVWYQDDPPLPLLVKFIFTSERLSVQVHPGDAYARSQGLERGKTEMWHVLRADPGGQIALGFRHEIDRETMRRAALDGSIVDLLRWFDVKPGESYLVSAGTVHALGAGVVVVEVQQTSDTTYRLFDYGRPRELHLTDAMAVSHLGPWVPPRMFVSKASKAPWNPVLRTAYFEVHTADVSHPFTLHRPDAPFALYVFTGGHGKIGGEAYREGECWLVEGQESEIQLEPARPTRILRAFPPKA